MASKKFAKKPSAKSKSVVKKSASKSAKTARPPRKTVASAKPIAPKPKPAPVSAPVKAAVSKGAAPAAVAKAVPGKAVPSKGVLAVPGKKVQKPTTKRPAMKVPERKPIPAGPSARSQASGSKILPREFLVDLAKAVRKAVRPLVLSLKGREIVGQAQSGDATFEIDMVAEKALLAFLKRARKSVAYYSEDSGYTTFATGHPQNLLVVDPIDGTRAARSGFEGCVVSVCSTRVIERPTYADADNALVMEIMGNRTFYAERGQGTKLYVDGHPRKISLNTNHDLEQLTWSMTVPARPAELIFPVAARLMDLSSLKGGFFACNSTSYSLTRLVSNQLDACVDFANRFYRDIPSIVKDQFINAGRGNVVGVCPYDFAAGLLIAHEAGCVVTDAYGDTLEDVLLLDSSETNNRSIIGASNAALYEKLFGYFDTRIKQYEDLLKRRHAVASAN
jgi:myo-inositol-1(or 4)-monophosphatase